MTVRTIQRLTGEACLSVEMGWAAAKTEADAFRTAMKQSILLSALPCKDGGMDETAFPPADLKAFLALCAGRWMSLRSRFDLGGAEEDWHASDRGELTVTFNETDGVSVLVVQPGEGLASELHFSTDGELLVEGEGGARSGRWQLRPDASLELELADSASHSTVLERIWFIKPNLRLRSTTAMAADGTPLQARFCSEIRRVSSPTK